jgi:hypothetical protein
MENFMLVRSTIVALSVLACSTFASAVPIYSTGFEAPEYSLGDLVGQNGWDAIGLAEEDLVAVNVQDAIVRTGSQAISLTGAGEGAGAYVYKTTPHVPLNETRIVVQYDMLWGANGTSKSSFYGVQAYDSEINLIGSVGVSQLFGFYNAVVFGPDDNAVTIPGAVVQPGQWHHFELVLDYETQSFHASMDGIPSPIMPFQSSGILDYGEVDFFRNAGASNSNDTAYFDNLNVNAVVVPEPASLAGVAGLACIRRRRA